MSKQSWSMITGVATVLTALYLLVSSVMLEPLGLVRYDPKVYMSAFVFLAFIWAVYSRLNESWVNDGMLYALMGAGGTYLAWEESLWGSGLFFAVMLPWGIARMFSASKRFTMLSAGVSLLPIIATAPVFMGVVGILTDNGHGSGLVFANYLFGYLGLLWLATHGSFSLSLIGNWHISTNHILGVLTGLAGLFAFYGSSLFFLTATFALLIFVEFQMLVDDSVKKVVELDWSDAYGGFDEGEDYYEDYSDDDTIEDLTNDNGDKVDGSADRNKGTEPEESDKGTETEEQVEPKNDDETGTEEK